MGPVFEWTKHKAIWNYIIGRLKKLGPDNNFSIVDLKKEAVQILYPDEKIPLNCYACLYDMQIPQGVGFHCKHCPLEWESASNSNECVTNHDNGVYDIVRETKDLEVAIKYAEIIRDLPVREGVRCA